MEGVFSTIPTFNSDNLMRMSLNERPQILDIFAIFVESVNSVNLNPNTLRVF